MKIAFICSSLAPGRDGVGDYARRLASELIRLGHGCITIALNDSHISETVYERQEIEGTCVSVLRLPSIAPWNKRVAEARKWLGDFNPDWVSFQFVPFGFHPKGLCFGLGKRLADINPKAPCHIMFHELWLGLGENASAKDRAWGALQRLIIQNLTGRLRPRIVHTQAEVYRIVLGREKIEASILPLFGNIPYFNGDGWNGLIEPLVTDAFGKPQVRTELYLAGVLGAVHPEWSPDQAVNSLLPLARRSEKKLVLVFLGRNNLTPDDFNQLKAKLQDHAKIVVVGERTNSEISRILQTLDLGLATSPRQNIQKSGSVAAMLEHGLSVLVSRNDWRLRGANVSLKETSPLLFSPEQFAMLEALPTRNLQPLKTNGSRQIADRLIQEFSSELA